MSVHSFKSPLNTTDVAPSPRQYPSPHESKEKHRPLTESIPAAKNEKVISMVNSPTEVATVSVNSFMCKVEAAKCMATSDDEHAVSREMHGPVSPSMCDTRPDATDKACAVPAYTEGILWDDEF